MKRETIENKHAEPMGPFMACAITTAIAVFGIALFIIFPAMMFYWGFSQ